MRVSHNSIIRLNSVYTSDENKKNLAINNLKKAHNFFTNNQNFINNPNSAYVKIAAYNNNNNISEDVRYIIGMTGSHWFFSHAKIISVIEFRINASLNALSNENIKGRDALKSKVEESKIEWDKTHPKVLRCFSRFLSTFSAAHYSHVRLEDSSSQDEFISPEDQRKHYTQLRKEKKEAKSRREIIKANEKEEVQREVTSKAEPRDHTARKKERNDLRKRLTVEKKAEIERLAAQRVEEQRVVVQKAAAQDAQIRLAPYPNHSYSDPNSIDNLIFENKPKQNTLAAWKKVKQNLSTLLTRKNSTTDTTSTIDTICEVITEVTPSTILPTENKISSLPSQAEIHENKHDFVEVLNTEDLQKKESPSLPSPYESNSVAVATIISEKQLFRDTKKKYVDTKKKCVKWWVEKKQKVSKLADKVKKEGN